MIRSKFSYTLYSISFPEDNAAEWKKLFKPCASQRLFLPVCSSKNQNSIYKSLDFRVSCPLSHMSLQLILKDIDSIVYVDSDILFLQPMDHLWAFLSKFTPSQLAAMAPEHEEPRIAWYSRFARHPFYGRTGVNSGVMLMNMTRMRSVSFKVQVRIFIVATRWRHCIVV